mgnify:CR=1 FL=1
MNVKQYLKKNGIKLGVIVLVLALILGLGSFFLKGNAGLLKNVTGIVKEPVQRVVSSVAEWLEGVYGYMYEYDELVAENERLRAELTKAQEEARNGYEAREENQRLRELLDFKEAQRYGAGIRQGGLLDKLQLGKLLHRQQGQLRRH